MNNKKYNLRFFFKKNDFRTPKRNKKRMAIRLKSENEGYLILKELFRRTTENAGEEVNGYRMNLYENPNGKEESYLEISWVPKLDERNHIIKYKIIVEHNGKTYRKVKVTQFKKNGIEYTRLITDKELIIFYMESDTGDIIVEIGGLEYYTKNIISIINDLFSVSEKKRRDRFETWKRIDIDRRELDQRGKELRERSLSRRRREDFEEERKYLDGLTESDLEWIEKGLNK